MKHAISPLELKTRIKNILPEMIEFRRNLHRFPEKGLEEFETSKKIRKRVSTIPCEVLSPIIGTDTVVILRGNEPGPNITLRADIDALEMNESSGVPWSSCNPGFAHCCGHDGHTAILMGAFLVLSDMKDLIAGSVRFVFQPGEEGFGGGKQLVEKGLLDQDPKPSEVFALHGWPGQALNTLSSGGGAAMAGSDRFTIKILGKGGHGARPHQAVDPLLTASLIVNGLQTIISRNTDPMSPAVLSVCSFHSGNADNVIPGTATLLGTTRYFDPSMLDEIKTGMERVIQGVSSSMGASYEFDYRKGYIPLVNDVHEVDFVRRTAEAWFGSSSWVDKSPPAATAEDFSFYLDKVPGAFIRLGLGEEYPGLHNPLFDFNDKAVETGITILVALVLEKLK